MTQDALTQAYNCGFVREHFHYTCINATRQNTMLYCVLFHISTYDETLQSHGQTAAGSLARAAADHICSVFSPVKPDFLALCHDDTFMMILRGMTHDHIFS